MKTPKFKRGQIVLFKGTNASYCITELPQDHLRLAVSGDPFYGYRSYGNDTDHIIWYRRQSEMEDGRFIERE